MPRKVAINPTPNPTGLTMAERQLAIAVIQSIREAMVRARNNAQTSLYWRQDWAVSDEQELFQRVCRAALNQFAGRQKTEKGVFQLRYDANVRDEDMDYVMQSLGYAEGSN